MKLLIKLAIAALIANAAWQLGSAYLSFYRFKDSVQQTAQFGSGKSDAALRMRILELAEQYDVPVSEEDFTIRRNEPHIYVDGGYRKAVQFVPGYTYPWAFEFKIDAFTVTP